MSDGRGDEDAPQPIETPEPDSFERQSPRLSGPPQGPDDDDNTDWESPTIRIAGVIFLLFVLLGVLMMLPADDVAPADLDIDVDHRFETPSFTLHPVQIESTRTKNGTIHATVVVNDTDDTEMNGTDISEPINPVQVPRTSPETVQPSAWGLADTAPNRTCLAEWGTRTDQLLTENVEGNDGYLIRVAHGGDSLTQLSVYNIPVSHILIDAGVAQVRPNPLLTDEYRANLTAAVETRQEHGVGVWGCPDIDDSFNVTDYPPYTESALPNATRESGTPQESTTG